MSYHYTPCQKSLCSFLAGPLQVLSGCIKMSPEPSLLQAEQPQLSQPFLTGEVLQPSDHFCGPPLDPLQQVDLFPGLQSWTQDSRLGLTRAEQRGRITSPDLLAILLLMQPRIWLAFWAVSTHCWVMMSFSSTSTPKSFSSRLLSIHSPLSLHLCLGLPWPMCRTLHLASWDSHRPTSQGCPCPSGCHPFPLQHVDRTTNLVLSANLLRVHSIPLSTSLTKMLNSAGPNTDPWGIQLVFLPTPLLLPGGIMSYEISIICWCH